MCCDRQTSVHFVSTASETAVLFLGYPLERCHGVKKVLAPHLNLMVAEKFQAPFVAGGRARGEPLPEQEVSSRQGENVTRREDNSLSGCTTAISTKLLVHPLKFQQARVCPPLTTLREDAQPVCAGHRRFSVSLVTVQRSKLVVLELYPIPNGRRHLMMTVPL